MKNRVLLFVMGLLCVQLLEAQTPSGTNLRKKKIPVVTTPYKIDPFSIIPNTFKISGVGADAYLLDEVNAILVWKLPPLSDSVWVEYRTFGIKLNAPVRQHSFDSISDRIAGKPFVFNSNNFGRKENDLFNFGNLNYNGSFGRGISFGNAQDAVVNSNLNLQLSGYLGDSVEIAAAITDNNIPIQPDGNTQQLNEFDRIWLRFSKKDWQLNLGDIDIRQNKNYFLNFYKRLQGISFEHTQHQKNGGQNNVLVSGSIAKGKFTRNIFQGLEGNQGPYRLQGANNEFFFVILAGTERVFIDGELLQRGEDQDYVINYNTAEISFTPKRMITKDKRIQVEFEYADRNFLNANLYLNDEWKLNNRLTLRLGAFNNSDAKNSPINQTLDVQQKQFLSDLGDSIQRAFYPVSSIDTFSAGKILYSKIDTAYDNRTDSIYVYDTTTLGTKYSLSFLAVGPGNGDYEPDFNGANGKVYRWIQPVNGVSQGSYAPVAYLVTPKAQQVITVGADYILSTNTVLNTDLAMSRYDVNTFSAKDKGNDQGFAAKFRINNTRKIGGKRKHSLLSEAGYEYVDMNFKPVERLRNVEFTRDWGLNLLEAPATEQLANAALELRDSAGNHVRYQLNTYHRSDNFSGARHTVLQNGNWKNFRTNIKLEYTKSEAARTKGYFLRPTIDISRKFSKISNITVGANYAREENLQRDKSADTLSQLSFLFETVQAYLRSDDQKANRWNLGYFTRKDKIPVGKELLQTDRSHNFNIGTELMGNERHQFRMNLTYRTLQVQRPLITGTLPDKSLLGRAEYSISEWKGLVTGNVLYELGSGQEQRRDFTYLEVPAGQGEYTWNDYNGDGIPQLNEFELAQFRDQMRFIRIYTPTNEFIKANYTTFNYSVNIQPRAIWNQSQQKGLKGFVARFNWQSSLQINKKEIASGITQFNPFVSAVEDTSLITLQSIFANTLSFNRFSTRWGMDISRLSNENKSVLTYGFESRELKEWNLKARWSVNRELLLDVTTRSGENILFTPKFENRNYRIGIASIEPRASFTRKTNLRLSLSYKMEEKENEIGFNEKAFSQSVISELKYNVLQNGSIGGKLTYNRISYSTKDPAAGTNSTVGYILLDGLLPGNNMLWNLELTKRLSNNLELNFQYEGRKPGESRTVHVGRASLRALF